MHTVCMAIACACMHARARAARAMRVCVARGRWRLRGPSTGLGAAPTKHAAFLVLAVRAVCEGVTDPRQDDTVPVRALHAVRTGERRARRPGHSRFCVGQPRGEQDRCRQEAAPASHAARACVHGEVGVALRRAAPSPRKPRGRGHGPAPCLRVGVTRPLFVCGQPPPPLQCHAVLHARARRWPRGTRRAVRASPCGVRVHTRVLVSGEGRSGSGLAKREGTAEVLGNAMSSHRVEASGSGAQLLRVLRACVRQGCMHWRRSRAPESTNRRCYYVLGAKKGAAALSLFNGHAEP